HDGGEGSARASGWPLLPGNGLLRSPPPPDSLARDHVQRAEECLALLQAVVADFRRRGSPRSDPRPGSPHAAEPPSCRGEPLLRAFARFVRGALQRRVDADAGREAYVYQPRRPVL